MLLENNQQQQIGQNECVQKYVICVSKIKTSSFPVHDSATEWV